MDRSAIERILRGLPAEQASVLYWKCQNLNYVEIGEKIGMAFQTVTREMAFVYEKLKDIIGIDKDMHWRKRKDALTNEVCPVLMYLIDNNPEFLIRFPLTGPILEGRIIEPTEEPEEVPMLEPGSEPKTEPVPEILALVLYDEILEEEEKKKAEIEKVKPLPPPIIIDDDRRRPWWLRLLILASVIGCLSCPVVAYGAYRFGRGTPIPFLPVQDTATIEPLVATETHTPTLADTPVPTNSLVLTETPTPTQIPTSTDTLTPSPSPTPTPTEVVLFYDDFSGGKSEIWQTQYGDPIIIGNALNFSDTTLLIIDAKDWTNYEVSFDVSNLYCQGGVTSSGVSIGLRLQNANNMVALRIAYWGDNCTGTWYVIKNGDWNKLPNSSFELPPKNSQGIRHFTISVEGGTYNCPFGVPVVIEDFASGGIALFADKGVVVDNFKVIPITP